MWRIKPKKKMEYYISTMFCLSLGVAQAPVVMFHATSCHTCKYMQTGKIHLHNIKKQPNTHHFH